MPSDSTLLSEKYTEVKEIFSMALSPTIVSIVRKSDEPEENYTPLIKKRILKSKLFGKGQIEQARQECALQMSLSHSGIVELYEYFESDDEFTMFMEYCNDSNYFENKIESKRSEVKNELKLRSFA